MIESALWLPSIIAARTIIVLVVLLLGIRVFGKRELSGMNIYDLVVVLAIANAVQNAMTEGSGQLGVGLASGGALLLVSRLLGDVFVRHPSIEARLVGTPTVIVRDGRLERDHMRREGVTEEEVLRAVRGYGLATLADVELAVLEVNGSLSVVPRDRSRQGDRKIQ